MKNWRVQHYIITILVIAHQPNFANCKKRKIREQSSKAISKMQHQEEISEGGSLLAPQLRFLVKPQNQAWPQYSNVPLECEAFGSPMPTVHWEFLGGQISKSLYGNKATSTKALRHRKILPQGNGIEPMINGNLRTYQQGSTMARLRIPCLDVGSQGRYVCSASNGHSTIVKQIDVKISEYQNSLRPACHKNQQGKKASPAQITMWTVDRVERDGVVVQMNCRAGGNPKPQISWFSRTAGDQFMEIKSGNPDYQKLSNGDLLVLNVTSPVMEHELKCMAFNVFGEDSVDPILFITKVEDEDI